MLKISWFSNSSFSASGYGNQTGLFVPRIRDLGHEISIAAYWGVQGGRVEADGITTYPASASGGIDHEAMAVPAKHFGADVIISLMDVWALPQGVTGGIPLCVPGDTQIALADGGSIDIKTLVSMRLSPDVVGYRDGQVVRANITAHHVNPAHLAGEMLEFQLSSGRTFRVTADNEVAIQTDGCGCLQWVESRSLAVGDVVYCNYSIQGVNQGGIGSQEKDESGSLATGGVLPAPVGSRMGVYGGDSGRRGNHLDYPQSQDDWRKAVLSAYPVRQCSEYQRSPRQMAGGHAGDENTFQAQGQNIGRGGVQARAHDVLSDRYAGISSVAGTGVYPPASDCQEEAGRFGDGIYQESVSGTGVSVQHTIHGARAGYLAGGPRVEPEYICSIRSLQRPKATVYDLTTSTGNFFADGVLIHNCPWFPVDSEPLPPPIKIRLTNQNILPVIAPMVFSRFAERMCLNEGITPIFVPHGCATDEYKPMDRQEARELIGLPQDEFIFGMVAANVGSPSRKAFKPQIEAFARLHKKHPDTRLYLHTRANTSGLRNIGGENLAEFVEQLGIGDAVSWTQPDAYHFGLETSEMRALYASFNVLTSVSMGEGFGIPILEAAACGIPSIVGDWTAMSELCFAGWKVAKEDAEPYHNPLAAYQYWPHIDAVFRQMEKAYLTGRGNHEKRSQESRLAALEYDVEKVTLDFWAPALQEIEARLERSKAPVSRFAEALGHV